MRKALSLIIPVIVIIPVFLASVLYGLVPAFILQILGARKAAETWRRLCILGIARWALFGLNVRVNTTGRENMPPAGTPLCIIVNHQSLLDVVAVVGYSGTIPGFIAKKELSFIPIIASYMKGLHCVMLDRKSPKSSIASISEGVKNITRGIPMVVFPEGTRSKDGKLGEFKAGSLKLATRSKATIVPIAISGGRKAFEERRGIRRTVMTMHICPPVPTHDFSREAEKEFTAQVYGELAEGYRHLLSRHEA
ncbi:lysophospholipid acyltransferase family protein [Parasphaerochaeta coccoides]|uniref:Phospholipid/glycerol acyltransferase n=1 Tax=Parasphaerochaeta coccoides (strain ATCC BAA-1237 / DSM 17374 / SPN1) TaxID=760011 RepID=F4GM59_PARC1|nr:lysophospholipid acyltransferase family protein [Parasphaerochaeta coccoides]AEC02534.1 phospholipid/glycerol acyltransferase [Parasphaerochaeta coccoides DSM 17374]